MMQQDLEPVNVGLNPAWQPACSRWIQMASNRASACVLGMARNDIMMTTIVGSQSRFCFAVWSTPVRCNDNG